MNFPVNLQPTLCTIRSLNAADGVKATSFLDGPLERAIELRCIFGMQIILYKLCFTQGTIRLGAPEYFEDPFVLPDRMIRLWVPVENTEGRAIGCDAQASFTFTKPFFGKLSFGDIE